MSFEVRLEENKFVIKPAPSDFKMDKRLKTSNIKGSTTGGYYFADFTNPRVWEKVKDLSQILGVADYEISSFVKNNDKDGWKNFMNATLKNTNILIDVEKINAYYDSFKKNVYNTRSNLYNNGMESVEEYRSFSNEEIPYVNLEFAEERPYLKFQGDAWENLSNLIYQDAVNIIVERRNKQLYLYFELPEDLQLDEEPMMIEERGIDETLEAAYINYCRTVESASESTIKERVRYLKSINAPTIKISNAVYEGIYLDLYKRMAPQNIFEIEDYEAFIQNYKAMIRLFEDRTSYDPVLCDGVSKDDFDKCLKWKANPKNHYSLSSAFNSYKKFLQEYFNGDSPKPTSNPQKDWEELKQELGVLSGGFYEATKDAGLKYKEDFVRRFVAALLAKPFVILTGLSGSGKTKLAQAFTSWLAPENTLIVPVGADWTNNEHLLGYPNALTKDEYVMPGSGVLGLLLHATEYPEEPHFLILDEMNLSHVERYFSDFLSAMESGDSIKLYDGEDRFANGEEIPQRLSIPKNVFVIGTMNVDETTYMFSPKVLDRAQVLEFRVHGEEMVNFLTDCSNVSMASLEGEGKAYAEVFLQASGCDGIDTLEAATKTAMTTALTKFFNPLAVFGAEFGYRTAREILLFAKFYDAMAQDEDKRGVVDAAIIQKLLPKLHGSQMHLTPTLDELLKLSMDNDTPIYPLTCEKVKRMKSRLASNGFTSFAEA